MVEALPHVLALVDVEIAEDVEAELARNGVVVHRSTPVDAIEGNGRVHRVIAGGQAIDAGLVIVDVGVGPESRLPREAGIPLGANGAVAVDERMRTAVPHVWAAGDCAQTRHLLHDAPAFVPLGTTANKQGRVVGGNIVGRDETFGGVIGTAAVKVFDLHVASRSVGARGEDRRHRCGRCDRLASVAGSILPRRHGRQGEDGCGAWDRTPARGSAGGS